MSYVKCIGCDYWDTPEHMLSHAEAMARWENMGPHGLEPPQPGDYICLCGGTGTMAQIVDHVSSENQRQDGTRHAIDLRQGRVS